MKRVTALLHLSQEQQEIERRLRALNARLERMGERYAKVGRYLQARRAASLRAA
jgi:DNA anti-recombination protein RmuC